MTTQSQSLPVIKNRAIVRAVALAVGGALALALLMIGLLLALLLTTTTIGHEILVNLTALTGLSALTPWEFSRAAGTVAYLLLAGSTVWGVLLSTRLLKEFVPGHLALAMHNILSWLAIAFTAFHALALLLDNYFDFSLINLLLPFSGPYQPFWVGLGIIGLYISIISTLSFYVRKQMGQTWWRRLHLTTYVAFVLATAHGVMAGTDSGNRRHAAGLPGQRPAGAFSDQLPCAGQPRGDRAPGS